MLYFPCKRSKLWQICLFLYPYQLCGSFDLTTAHYCIMIGVWAATMLWISNKQKKTHTECTLWVCVKLQNRGKPFLNSYKNPQYKPKYLWVCLLLAILVILTILVLDILLNIYSHSNTFSFQHILNVNSATLKSHFRFLLSHKILF